jgi:hypothetical protein
MKSGKQQGEDHVNRQRKYDHQPAIGACLILELTTPLNFIARRKFKGTVDLLLRKLYETSKVCATLVRLNGNSALRVLPG